MICAKFSTILKANNHLARGGGGGTYETPYTLGWEIMIIILDQSVSALVSHVSCAQTLLRCVNGCIIVCIPVEKNKIKVCTYICYNLSEIISIAMVGNILFFLDAFSSCLTDLLNNTSSETIG